jgi:hypothetical protein
MEERSGSRTMYLSADGAIPVEYLQSFPSERVMLAMNQDEVGQRMGLEIRETLPQVRQLMLEQADWVKTLQMEKVQSIRQQLQRER